MLAIEVRRALRRRAVRVLIVIAVIGCAVAGVIAFTSSSGKSVFEMQEQGQTTHPAVLTDWWVSGTGDGLLALGFLFLLLGALIGGATVAGAEWRFDTITSVLTWEPRRWRVHGARLASAGILAFAISFVLQVLLLLSFLPAVLVNGSSDGADLGWWLALLAAMIRVSVLTSLSAMVAVSMATLGRNTSFALVVAFAWMAVIENVIRGVVPSATEWLWGENIAIVFTWSELDADDVDFSRTPLVALLTLITYVAVICWVAGQLFDRRDIATSS